MKLPSENSQIAIKFHLPCTYTVQVYTHTHLPLRNRKQIKKNKTQPSWQQLLPHQCQVSVLWATSRTLWPEDVLGSQSPGSKLQTTSSGRNTCHMFTFLIYNVRQEQGHFSKTVVTYLSIYQIPISAMKTFRESWGVFWDQLHNILVSRWFHVIVTPSEFHPSFCSYISEGSFSPVT